MAIKLLLWSTLKEDHPRINIVKCDEIPPISLDVLSKLLTDGHRGCSGSVVECSTRDREAKGSSLTALWSLSKTFLS